VDGQWTIGEKCSQANKIPMLFGMRGDMEIEEIQDDKRIQRTKQLLHSALMSLLTKKRFDKITIQDIIERANVGRTTFYAHFESKEDLFLSSHEQIIHMISRSYFTEQRTLRADPSPDLIAFLEASHDQRRNTYFFLTWGQDKGKLLRLLSDRIAAQLEICLHERFEETNSVIPFAVLAQHVAGSMISLVGWWLDKPTPYTPREIATMLHHMNEAALRRGLGLHSIGQH
jgi:AcrR family transcriptional regulator